MNEELGSEYEKWLDGVEHTLPLPIPEEEDMDRTEMIQHIQDKLARLEEERASTDIQSVRYDEICVEMDHLRDKLSRAMNSICPLLESYSEEA